MADDKDKQDDLNIPEPETLSEDDTPPQGYTEEEWRDLSPSERDGIKESLRLGDTDDEPEEELTEEQLQAVVGEETPPEEEAITEVITSPEEEPKPTPEIVTDDQLLAYRPLIDESQLPALPEPEPEIISNDIQLKLDELDKKYDDGDVKLTEYNRERDAINRQIINENNTRNQAIRDEAIANRTQTRADLVWRSEQATFFKTRPEYEYLPEGTIKGKILYGALNEIVKSLDADPMNTGLSGMALLLKADKQVKEAFGTLQKAEDKSPEVKPKAPERKPPAPLPKTKTLADIPNAAPNETGGPYAGLDKLRGQAYEDALERLTPAQRDRYLAAR